MPYTYALVGLTPSERALLESIFALDAAEGEDLAQVRKPEEADLLIVNGDDRAVVQQLRGANQGALLVLVGRPGGDDLADVPVLPRPLDMTGVVRVLSSLDWPLERRSQPADFVGTFSPSSTPMSRPPDSRPPESQPPEINERDRMAFAPTTLTAPINTGGPGLSAAAAPPLPPVPASATWVTPERQAPASVAGQRDGGFRGLPDDVDADVMVVVGPHGSKRHTLSLGLRKLGYRVRVVDGAEAAQQSLTQLGVSFVFMDQASLGDQLMPLARALVSARQLGQEHPHLVVVARHGGLFDRLRARMHHCTWMVAPLERERLVAFLTRRGLIPYR